MKVWVINDGKVGNTNQCKGVADKLGYGYEEKSLEEIREFLDKPHPIRWVKRVLNMENAWPDIVISSDKESAQLAAKLKRVSPKSVYALQLMDPGGDTHLRAAFDCIAIPEHSAAEHAPNVIRTVGVAHRITSDTLQAGAAEWEDKFAGLPKPHIAVLLGGKIPEGGDISPEEAAELSKKLAELQKSTGGSLLITNSRRTSQEATQALMENLSENVFFHDWHLDQGKTNPYFGLLNTADYIVATGDSMSMCCEAAGTGKPLYIYAAKGNTIETHQKLHEQLYELNAARPLTSATEKLEKWAYEPINTAESIAEHVRGQLEARHRNSTRQMPA